MSDKGTKQEGLSSRLFHIMIVVIVVAGFAIPWGLKAAERYLDWTPPANVKKVLDWLPM